jgi:hypothetical protein
VIAPETLREAIARVSALDAAGNVRAARAAIARLVVEHGEEGARSIVEVCLAWAAAEASDIEVNAKMRRLLPDGRILEVFRLIYTWRLTVTHPRDDGICWEDAWCYPTLPAIAAAFFAWNGEGEPDGWIRHPVTGRRRPDGTAASEIAIVED